jgi:hypothetical protein
VSTDGQPSDPRTSLPGAIEALATGGELETVLERVLAAGVAALRPAMGAIFISDPDRPGLQLVASHGMDDGSIARLAGEVTDPAHPFSAAATSRLATFDREAAMPDGSAFVGAYLPLIVSSRGVDIRSGRSGSAGRHRGSSTTPSARR